MKLSSREGLAEEGVAAMDMVMGPIRDRTNVHRIWKAGLICTALALAAACLLAPILFLAIGLLLVLLMCARFMYRRRDCYVPHLYARDIRVYDEKFCEFIGRTLSDLRKHKIAGHTLLWEASRMAEPRPDKSDELVLDLGVWIGWSTRLLSEACHRKVYGFDTFSGLVEDWQVEDRVIKRGTFSLSEPMAQFLIRDTGVTIQDGLPSALGRDVQFIRGSTYDTLEPFLAERPAAPITLFHMDLDTYESCLHGLETCKERFVEGTILVFDEYLVTNSEMRAFYEFQSRYELQWRYRAWGLEIMEMNIEMIAAPWKRMLYYVGIIPVYWLFGEGRFAWEFFHKPFWRFWLGAPMGDLFFLFGAAGSRKSVSIEITGLGKLQPTR